MLVPTQWPQRFQHHGYSNMPLKPQAPGMLSFCHSMRAPVAIGRRTSQMTTSQVPSTTNDASLEAAAQEEWLSMNAQQQRRILMNIAGPKAAAFIKDSEFVSLGCFCGVARTLQCLGIKQFTYPFDWTRCPLDGVVRLLDTNFEDFLSYSSVFEHERMKAFGGSKWGGSFWHHDPDAASTKTDMARRIDRFFGKAEVPASKARMFIRACNSSAELEECAKLRESLCRALPQTRIYLLLIVDLQTSVGPVGVSGDGDLLLWRVHEKSGPMEDGKGGWIQGWSMQTQCEAYAQGVAFAIRLWSGEEALSSQVQIVADLSGLSQVCDAFAGSDPAKELWLPKKLPKQIYISQKAVDLCSSQASVDTRASTSKLGSGSPSSAASGSLVSAPPSIDLSTSPATESKSAEASSNDRRGVPVHLPKSTVDATLPQTSESSTPSSQLLPVGMFNPKQTLASLWQGTSMRAPVRQLQGSFHIPIHQGFTGFPTMVGRPIARSSPTMRLR